MSQDLTPDSRSVAFFDFDGTLTTGDTLMPFLQFVVGKPIYYAKLFLLSPVFVVYFAKLLRNDVAKQIVLKKYLSGYHVDDLFKLGERFSEEVIPTMLRPEGMERLSWHQEQGHDCVLVSASLDVYLKYWAKENGFQSALTTCLSSKEGVVSGNLLGNNCYGDEKVVRVSEWIRCRSTRITYYYGDAQADIPMAKKSDYGFIWNGKVFLRVDK
ncbi:HAD-superfamily subfamily IB hydrolase, TIGR01490 [Franzmannia pantelleriensis]|uniref:HAD-superfamily subfamily IB hydrolase, TIGR01490 n=1 Tax=Franzmannia pantelleriensis TaxID=48727 RepID=A0A1G9ETR2_9GAMM|nr:HAD-IB family hydrolase [Halomonas pantelleriensis]SDK79461.1 HAD-superfamily subfamily IB hydrolase, TIGR01490 [Halomonas pantelleriensis]